MEIIKDKTIKLSNSELYYKLTLEIDKKKSIITFYLYYPDNIKLLFRTYFYRFTDNEFLFFFV